MTVPGSTLAWAANVIGSAATVVRVEQLRMRSGPWLLRIEHDGATSDAVLKSGPAVDWRESYACEKAALELAAANDLPVPRILGSRLDATGDEPVALLMTWIPGTVRIPQVASVDRLRALGRLAAMLHAIALAPSERLPMRVRHTGGEAASGRPARDVAYWDLAAALNTPADMRRILPALHEAGRTDLEADTLTARQGGFLRTALERLDDERP